jgi:hypothetical protein
MPNAHGTKKAYEVDKCRCDICVPAQRGRWADKDARKRERASGPDPSRPVIGERPALRVVRQAEATPAKPQESAASEPASAAPPVPLRAARSIEMPRLWPIYDTEPEYAEEHREALAAVVLYIMKDPAHNYSNPTLDNSSSRQEAKDFERLLTLFQKANSGLIEFTPIPESFKGWPWNGAYYEFQVISPQYEYPEGEGEAGTLTGWAGTLPPLVAAPGPERRQDGAPGGGPGYERRSWPVAKPATARRARANPGPAKPRNVPMGNAPSVPGRAVRQSDTRLPTYELRANAYGMCEAKLYAESSFCSHAVGSEAEWKYRVDSRPVCQNHYNAIRITHPERCQYQRNGQWVPDPLN